MKKLVIPLLLLFSAVGLADEKPEFRDWGEDGPIYTVMSRGCGLFALPTINAAAMSFWIDDKIQLVSGPYKDLFGEDKTWYKFRVLDMPAQKRIRDRYALFRPVSLTEGYMHLEGIEYHLLHDGSNGILSPFRQLAMNIWSEYIVTEEFEVDNFGKTRKAQVGDIFMIEEGTYVGMDRINARAIYGSLKEPGYGYVNSVYISNSDLFSKMREETPDFSPKIQLVAGAWYRAIDEIYNKTRLNYVYEFTGNKKIINKGSEQKTNDDEKSELEKFIDEHNKYASDEEFWYEFILIGRQDCATGAIDTDVYQKEKPVFIEEYDCLPNYFKRISKDVLIIRDEHGSYIDEEGRIIIRVHEKDPEKRK